MNVSPINHNEDAVRTAINAAINNGITQSQISNETSVGKTRLSQFLSDTYKGDNSKIVSDLHHWLEMQNSRKNNMPTAPDFVETTTARQIFNTLRYAHVSRGDGMTVVMGAPGTGKSKAVEQYAKASPNCWVVIASPSIAGMIGFFYELALEIGLENPPRRKDSLCHAIRTRLKDSGGLIIIDEADHLQLDVIEELRVIQQRIGVGLALVGNPRVYSKMVGDSRKIDLSRLESRISKKLSLLKVKKRDIDAIASAWGLTSPKEVELIHKIADSKGQLRKLSHTLRYASMLAQGNNERLSDSHIRSAFDELKQEQ